jgi:hypothetical protein
MKFRLQQMGIVCITVAASYLSGGCSENKVSQCANVIKVVNQTVTETKTITAAGTQGDLPRIEKLVEIFDKAGKNLDGVGVSDEKLKTYKSQFVAMYQGATASNKRLVEAIKEKKSTKVYEELKKSNDIFSPERDLVSGVTQYCKEPDKK